jgi:hypothetical protein
VPDVGTLIDKQDVIVSSYWLCCPLIQLNICRQSQKLPKMSLLVIWMLWCL